MQRKVFRIFFEFYFLNDENEVEDEGDGTRKLLQFYNSVTVSGRNVKECLSQKILEIRYVCFFFAFICLVKYSAWFLYIFLNIFLCKLFELEGKEENDYQLCCQRCKMYAVNNVVLT